MNYNDTPKPRDQMLDTQQPINDNFANIKPALAFNHIGFDVVGVGNHNKMTFLQQSADDLAKFATLPPNLIGMFAQIYTGSDKNNNKLTLYAQKKSVAYEISAATAGWTTLPAGLLIKYGLVNRKGPWKSGIPITIHIDFGSKNFSSIYSIIVSANYVQARATTAGETNSTVSYDNEVPATGFDIIITPHSTRTGKGVLLPLSYIVIGIGA